MLKYQRRYLIAPSLANSREATIDPDRLMMDADKLVIDPDKLARIFSVLSVNTRVRLVALLQERPRCVNALAHELGITPAAVSQHLRVLRDADLVTAQKRGYFVHYSINPATLEEWAGLVESLFDRSKPKNGGAFAYPDICPDNSASPADTSRPGASPRCAPPAGTSPQQETHTCPKKSPTLP